MKDLIETAIRRSDKMMWEGGEEKQVLVDTREGKKKKQER